MSPAEADAVVQSSSILGWRKLGHLGLQARTARMDHLLPSVGGKNALSSMKFELWHTNPFLPGVPVASSMLPLISYPVRLGATFLAARPC